MSNLTTVTFYICQFQPKLTGSANFVKRRKLICKPDIINLYFYIYILFSLLFFKNIINANVEVISEDFFLSIYIEPYMNQQCDLKI